MLVRSEFHLRRRLHVLGHCERLHRLVVLVKRGGPDHAGKGAQLRVVLPHRLDVVAARHCDAVLRAFELRLQREKILVRFEIGIALRNRQQPSERAGELRLRVLKALERFRIVDDIGRNLHLNLGCPRARVDHFLEHLPLLRGVALHRLDQIGNEIGAALVLIEHVRPFRLGRFVITGNVVDAAAREQEAETRDQHGNAGKAQHARCVAHGRPPILTSLARRTPAAATAYSQPAQSEAVTLVQTATPSPRPWRGIIAMLGRMSAPMELPGGAGPEAWIALRRRAWSTG